MFGISRLKSQSGHTIWSNHMIIFVEEGVEKMIGSKLQSSHSNKEGHKLNKNMKWVMLAVCCLLFVFASGCKQSSPEEEQEQGGAPIVDETPEETGEYTGGPVEIVIKDQNTAIASDENIGQVIVNQVKAKYPDITIKYEKTKIEDLLIAGTPPDLVAASPSAFLPYLELDLPDDLQAMIKRLQIDLTAVESDIVETIEKFSDNGAFLALPFAMNHGATIYNQDLFNKFGTEFPEEVMTWEEFLELSKLMTRKEDDVQYIGGAPAWTIVNQFRQYGASTIDSSGEKANLNAEGFHYVFRMLEKFYQIPGMVTGEKYAYGNNDFFKDQTLAMYTGYMASHLNQLTNNPPNYNWDLGAFPVYEGLEKTGNPLDFHMLAVSKTSKHKEAAYRVMEALLSPEAQLAISKAGRISVLNDPVIKQTYAEDIGIFKDKNLQAVFSIPNSPLVPSDFSVYRDAVAPILRDTVRNVALNNTDINSALRTAEEKANLAIDEQKSGK